MPVATYQIDILGRGGKRSPVKHAAYGSGTKVVQSIVAAASYRSGEQLRDQQLGHTFDYSSREDVQHADILLPEHAPDWAADRQSLWNAVEQREKHPNAQLARALIIALPRELTLEQNVALVRAHLQEQFVSKGMVADFAIHVSDATQKEGEVQGLPFDGKNPHAHVLLTLRGFNADGTWQKQKNRDWNGWNAGKDRDKDGNTILYHRRFDSASQWRDAWEKLQNAHLEAAGSDARVDMRSYEKQGRDQLPTEHLGYDNHQKEQQGIRTEVGDHNRAVQAENARRAQAREQASATAKPAPEQPQAGADIAASHDNRQQAERERPATPAEGIRRDSERQQRYGTSWRWMKDSVAGWQRYWDQQAAWWQQKYATLSSKETYEKFLSAFTWGAKPAQESPDAKPDDLQRPKPQRVWSQEQRADYQMLHPYLQQHADLTTKERAHAVAAHMQVVQQQREYERRAVMQQIAERQARSRYRSIEQDRPLPVRERTRQRG